MAVVGVLAKHMFPNNDAIGAIGTSMTATWHQTKGLGNILALPLLRMNWETDDETKTEAYIFEFVDGGVPHGGKFMAVAAQSCTSIKWACDCDHSFNNPTRLIFYFG